LNDQRKRNRMSYIKYVQHLKKCSTPRTDAKGGVQDKINVLYTDVGEIGFGDGSLCSTHILKFERRNCPYLVLNEFFCMSLAKTIGLPVANVTFKQFGEFPALLVERFDRKFDSSEQKVFKRHLIDACQALDLPRVSIFIP